MSFEVRFNMLSIYCVYWCSSLCTHFAYASLMILSMPTHSAFTLLSVVESTVGSLIRSYGGLANNIGGIEIAKL